jgi:dTDP-4-dehydrorhamnose 3,5-epimerase
MRVATTVLEGVLLIEPKIFGDQRGFFLETYRREPYQAAGVASDFVQDNWSRSNRGVLRGLHFQEPHAQGKLVQVIRGAIFDAVVDVRRGSPNFGRWAGIELTGDAPRQLWVPPGFAHGFLTLADGTDVIYKCTDQYAPEHEHCLLWNDPAVGIAWPDLVAPPQLSAKDTAGVTLSNLTELPSFARL